MNASVPKEELYKAYSDLACQILNFAKKDYKSNYFKMDVESYMESEIFEVHCGLAGYSPDRARKMIKGTA